MSMYCSESEVNKKAGYSSSEEEEETAQEKKLRLAKQYLSQIQVEGKAIQSEGPSLSLFRMPHYPFFFARNNVLVMTPSLLFWALER